MKGLVLSGGATYGIAHVGVIKRLEEKSIKCDYVIGNSMGSIIAAAYACGMSSSEMEKIILDLKINKIIDNFYIAILKVVAKKLSGKRINGVFGLNKIEKFLRKIFGDKKIEDCKIKLEIPTVNLTTGKVIYRNSGDIVGAILDSICIPGMFDPKNDNADGMIRVNFPIVRASQLCDEIIGCHFANLGIVSYDILDNSIINVLLRAQEICGYEQVMAAIDEAMENCKDVIVINPNLNSFSIMDFDKIKNIMDSGYMEACKYI